MTELKLYKLVQVYCEDRAVYKHELYVELKYRNVTEFAERLSSLLGREIILVGEEHETGIEVNLSKSIGKDFDLEKIFEEV